MVLRVDHVEVIDGDYKGQQRTVTGVNKNYVFFEGKPQERTSNVVVLVPKPPPLPPMCDDVPHDVPNQHVDILSMMDTHIMLANRQPPRQRDTLKQQMQQKLQPQNIP